jgi:hypothetical protein
MGAGLGLSHGRSQLLRTPIGVRPHHWAGQSRSEPAPLPPKPLEPTPEPASAAKPARQRRKQGKPVP